MKRITVYTLLYLLFTAGSIRAQVPNYVPTNGLVAWYSFNNDVNDLSGNGNTPANSGASFVADRFGNANSALDFDGLTDVMTLNTPSFKFSESGEFSISIWIYKRNQTSAGVVLMSGSQSAGNFITNIQGPSQFQFGTNEQQSAWTWASCNHTLNVWDHYVCTYSAGNMTIYKNGVNQTSVSRAQTGAASVILPFYFGRGLPGGANNYNGQMDDIGIWTRALTSQEIMALYTFPASSDNSLKTDMFSMYPNPASDRLTVELSVSTSFSTYQIIDGNGRTIQTGTLPEQKSTIDISGLPPAHYFIQINDERAVPFQVIRN